MDKYSSLSFDSLSEIFWNESLPVNQSTFVPYQNSTNPDIYDTTNRQNMNKRMIGFVRKLPRKGEMERGGGEEPEKERCYQHMLNERMRREKEKESYLVLHSMLPRGTKNDKNSIAQMAAATIEELQRYKEELCKRNSKVEAMLKAGEEEEEDDGASKKIRIRRAENPASGVDSMVAVLKRLKTLKTKIRAIRSNFSAQQFSAEFVIQTTQVGAGVGEGAMQKTRQEIEGQFPSHFEEAYMC